MPFIFKPTRRGSRWKPTSRGGIRTSRRSCSALPREGHPCGTGMTRRISLHGPHRGFLLYSFLSFGARCALQRRRVKRETGTGSPATCAAPATVSECGCVRRRLSGRRATAAKSRGKAERTRTREPGYRPGQDEVPRTGIFANADGKCVGLCRYALSPFGDRFSPALLFNLAYGEVGGRACLY